MVVTGDIIASRQLYKVAFGSCRAVHNALVDWHLKRQQQVESEE